MRALFPWDPPVFIVICIERSLYFGLPLVHNSTALNAVYFSSNADKETIESRYRQFVRPGLARCDTQSIGPPNYTRASRTMGFRMTMTLRSHTKTTANETIAN